MGYWHERLTREIETGDWHGSLGLHGRLTREIGQGEWDGKLGLEIVTGDGGGALGREIGIIADWDGRLVLGDWHRTEGILRRETGTGLWDGTLGRDSGTADWEGTLGRESGAGPWDGTAGWDGSMGR